MTKKLTNSQVHAKLVKIAQDELDIANGSADGTVGPQEVVDSLVEVIDDLQDTVEAIPAEPSEPSVEEPQEPLAEGIPAEAPAAPEEETTDPDSPLLAKTRTANDDDDDDDDKKKDAKIRTQNLRIASLEQHIAKEELSKIAKDYAQTVHNDTNQQQAKYDEVMASGKSVSYWTARLEAIDEYTEANNVNTQFAKPAKNISAYRVAKLENVDISELSI